MRFIYPEMDDKAHLFLILLSFRESALGGSENRAIIFANSAQTDVHSAQNQKDSAHIDIYSAQTEDHSTLS